MKAMDVLAEFEKLQPNWDSYGARPIDPRCIQKAREILSALTHAHLGWTPVPTNHGGVQLEYHAEGFDIEVLIERSDDSGTA